MIRKRCTYRMAYETETHPGFLLGFGIGPDVAGHDTTKAIVEGEDRQLRLVPVENVWLEEEKPRAVSDPLEGMIKR
jgi:hypothetical protein